MSATPATKKLDKLGLAYQLHEYAYDPKTKNIGQHAAAALGVDPARLFKCLMFGTQNAKAFALVPTSAEMNLKSAAKALKQKKVDLLPLGQAEKITGYVIGGISPIGQKSRAKAFLDQSALDHETILVNGGKRGLQIEIAAHDLITACNAQVVELT